MRFLKLAAVPPHLKKTLAVLLGAGGGFAYYHFVACSSSTCPITGNPWLSTAYGALIGWIAAPSMKKNEDNSSADRRK
ncbi:MAG: DUF6132 family protein [Bacteroidota bacterium]